jgi:hypothetical protein
MAGDAADLYEQFARIGKAVGSARRVQLLDLLCQGERGVDALARTSGMTVTNTSQHLQALRAARRRGFRARRLEDGFPEWRLAGLPVAVGAEER